MNSNLRGGEIYSAPLVQGELQCHVMEAMDLGDNKDWSHGRNVV